ncbi:MAG: hypothetical protein HYY25_13700 [Candidatus Wallbacteria bacterium]|nr:hypothetical protein [Candidatus Wallbacteria bacterium]
MDARDKSGEVGVPDVRGLGRLAVGAFVAWHVIAIVCAGLALPEPTRGWLISAVGPYLRATGCWEVWDMFAPNPPVVNTRLSARVTLASGEVRLWRFPGLDGLSMSQRTLRQLDRQWSDRLSRPENAAAWPDAARYIGRLHAQQGLEPRRVELIREQVDIPPMAAPEEQRSRSGPAVTRRKMCFFTLELPAGAGP